MKEHILDKESENFLFNIEWILNVTCINLHDQYLDFPYNVIVFMF